MSTFELTWDESRNNAYTPSSTNDQAEFLIWAIKALLMGQNFVYKDYTNTTVPSPTGAWACYYSCNGTTAGTAGDNVDRWGSTYTPANLVWNSGAGGAGAPGVVHSWIVLKSIWGLYMLISFWSQGGGQYDARFCYSLTAPTGGSTTVDPTMTNSFGHSNAGGSIGSSIQFAMNNSGAIHISGWLARNGEAMITWSHDGDGHPYGLFMARQLTETHTGDNHNAHVYWETSGASWPLIQWFNQPGIESPGWQSRCTNQATTPTTVEVGEAATYPQTTISVFNDLPSTDPIDGAVCDFPIRIYSYTANYKSVRGRLQDVCLAPVNASGNVEEPSGAGPYQSITYGSLATGAQHLLWLPWHDPSVGLSL